MAKPYYIVIVRDTAESAWEVQFGSYDRDDCEYEVQDLRNHGCKKADVKLVNGASGTQEAIDNIVAAHNIKF